MLQRILVVGIEIGQYQVVLCHADTMVNRGRLIHLIVKPHLLDDGLHQRAGVALVIDGEVGAEPQPVGLGPENT